MTGVFTVGHSNHSIDRLLDLLRSHGVTDIADVRSHDLLAAAYRHRGQEIAYRPRRT